MPNLYKEFFDNREVEKMKEQEVMLKSYRREIEVLILTLEVPYYQDTETRQHFLTYEEVLTRLFNNKREEQEVLEIRNYYDNNKITVCINLTDYMDHGYYDENKRKECIEHIKSWLTSGIDVSGDMVEQEVRKGYIYSIPDYMNNIRSIVNDEFVENYVILEE